MKPGSIFSYRVVPVLLLAGLTLAMAIWSSQTAGAQQEPKSPRTDTVPKNKTGNREKKVRDLDEVIDELDREELEKEFGKAQAEMEKALKSLDQGRIKLEIQKALEEVKSEKFRSELSEAMAELKENMAKLKSELALELDSNRLRLETQKALQQADLSRLGSEISRGLAAVDWEKMQKELSENIASFKTREFEQEMTRFQTEMAKLGPELKKELERSKVKIAEIREEMKAYRDFVNVLDKDGLINKKEPYSIHHENGELTINGKKVEPAVYARYREFLGQHKKFTLEKSADDFNIDLD